MTGEKIKGEKIKSFFMIILFFLISFTLSDEISEYALEGLRLALNVIIPTAFPFMILSEFAESKLDFSESRTLKFVFEKFFHIGGGGIPALISGILGGFPVGAKSALEIYKNGKISKNECERLLCLSNIPSIAYVISAVGIGMQKSFFVGLSLYFITFISALFSSIVFGFRQKYSSNKAFISRQNFNFISSVKRGAGSSLNIIFFISFFSVICGLIKKYIGNTFLPFLLLPFAEVGNAAAFISESCILPYELELALISFSLSFSGFSVMMQSLAFYGGDELSMKRCVKIKLMQGLISFALAYLIFSAF